MSYKTALADPNSEEFSSGKTIKITTKVSLEEQES